MPFQAQFGNCADEFQRYRPDYPPTLYLRMLGEIADPDRRCAMDLGAGTGIVTKHLAAHFRQVIAVEPKAGMAAKIAEQFPDVTIRQGTAEECVQPHQTVDLITIGNALHWMDAERVFRNAHGWLRESGVLAVFDRPLPRASPPLDAITTGEFRGPWRPYRDPRLRRHLNWQDQTRTAVGFHVIAEARFSNTVLMTVEEYVGFWRSTSFGSAYANTLVEPKKYWNDLESRLTVAGASSTVSVDFSSTLIILRKA